MSEDAVREIAAAVGGTITEMQRLPDGSGFAVMSMPLPANHWSTQPAPDYEPPPMPFRMGSAEHVVVSVFPNAGYPDRTVRMTRLEWADVITAAGKYAYRASTMQGKEPDLDPDALLQNLVVAFLGYWTDSGLSSDSWANPPASDAVDPDGGATTDGPRA